MTKTLHLAILLIILAPVATIIPGCPAGTYGSIIELGKQAQIVLGKTTKAQLIQLLGNPDDSRNLGAGKEELAYVRKTISDHYNFFGYGNSKKTEFWIVLKNGIVEAYGERATM